VNEKRIEAIKVIAAAIVRCSPALVRVEPYDETTRRLDCWIEGTHEIVAYVDLYDDDDPDVGPQDAVGELLREVRGEAYRQEQALEDALKFAK
jgi:hypothetical protein